MAVVVYFDKMMNKYKAKDKNKEPKYMTIAKK
jgi:hypothetical protein